MGHIITFVVINAGKGTKVLQEAKKIGVTGGTIFRGKGTVSNRILELLGLDEARKEIVIMVSGIGLEDNIYKLLLDRFHMDKAGHGIAFSLPVNRVIGVSYCSEPECYSRGGGMVAREHEVIFIIVDRGRAEEIVEAAKAAGAGGATIINARGSGIHENSRFFAIQIEPEKEIVMVIIARNKTETIIKAIKDTIHIDEPGKGIMFVMDVKRALGLRDYD